MVLDWIKFIKKLDNKKQDIIFETIQKILSWDDNLLDIKPISWKKWYFRCREWDLRIIFLIENNKIFIKKVWNRWDVYKWLKNI
jgi:mRNA-degrading endonuclease RelE of RelBE toxin-antitoxin system